MRRLPRLCVYTITLTIVLGFSFYARVSRAATWAEVVARVQKRLDLTQSFRANFEQSSTNRSLEATLVSRGRVLIKRPNNVLWEYQEPDRQLFVTKGDSFYIFLPADRQVWVKDTDEVFNSKFAALFLSGRGKISDDFRADEGSDGSEEVSLDEQGRYRLILYPRQPMANWVRLILSVEPKTYQILQTDVSDSLGNEVAVTFSDIELNDEISDEEFQIKIPPDFEIIDAESYLP